MVRLAVFILHHPKLPIAIAASIFLMYVFSRDLMISLRESIPTPIRIDRWKTDYRGEQWLKLSGFADLSLGVMTSTDIAFVPVVAENYKKGDPIHAVIVTSPQRMQQFRGDVTVEGVIARSGTYDMRSIMHRNSIDNDVVCLNEDTQPDGIGFPLIMMGVAMVLGSFSIYALYKAAWPLIPPREQTPLRGS